MKISVFCSGNGSNLQALIDATRAETLGDLSRIDSSLSDLSQDQLSQNHVSRRAERLGAEHLGAEIALVVSDKPGCKALSRAIESGIPAFAFQPKDFPEKSAYEDIIAERVENADCRLIVLAGYMRILSPRFIDRFAGRIINIHPSLLPAFPGAHGIRDAWNQGAKVTGCTVHAVVSEVDAGPIIDQRTVRVESNDTLETLEARIHDAEHLLLPDVVRRIASGEIVLPIVGTAASSAATEPSPRPAGSMAPAAPLPDKSAPSGPAFRGSVRRSRSKISDP